MNAIFPIFAKYKSTTIFQVYQSHSMKLKLHIFHAVLMALMISVPAAQAQKLGLNTVVIDPGHGGKDAGAISADKKTMEKNLVLDISERLQKKITAAYPSVKVLMTRSKDNFVELNNRASFASQNGASLFISVHINSVDGKRTGPNGYSIHILGPSNDKNKDTYAFNMDVCKRENEVILLEDDYSTTYQGFDPNDPESDIYLRLMANSYREQSFLFAQLVDQKMKSGPFAKGNGIYQNNFAVLRLASMPAVLLEMGFISNPNDLAQLRKSSSIDKMVNNLFEAFCEYKTIYDESVGAPAVKPKKDGQAAAKPAEVKNTEEPKKADEVKKPAEPKKEDAKVEEAGETYYATQVLASGKQMDPKDKYFLGYEMRKVYTGKLYKYFIGISTDINKAKEMSREIRKKYSDAFLVKVENGTAVRVNQ